MHSPPHSCPSLPVEDLVAWLDGELGAADSARVAAHVSACASCAHEADLLHRSGELLAELPGRTPSADFADRVVRAVRAPETPDTAPPRARSLTFPRWAAAAAAVLVVTVGAWWVASPDDPARLSSRDEQEIARDLVVLSHLDVLTAADADELASIADDLDVIDAAAETERENGG